MSGVTITAGVSFSGGFTFTEAPVVLENTAAWFGGGYLAPPQAFFSTVDRITFATDTATASVRGPLSLAKTEPAAVSNTTYAWFGGGMIGVSPYTRLSTVERITYATDTAAMSTRGPLSAGRQSIAAAGNTTDGWFADGEMGAPAYAPVSLVDRITYATDTATASVRGPLSSARRYFAAAGNTTDGWFGGGFAAPPLNAAVSTVDRITYATDTATASVRGPLSLAKFSSGAAGNTTDGWFAGGRDSSPAGDKVSRVDRITYATDTATAAVRGPLTSTRYRMAAAGNTTDGWFGGGGTTSLAGTTVNRITYATDTNTASTRGPLSLARGYLAAAGGIQ